MRVLLAQYGACTLSVTSQALLQKKKLYEKIPKVLSLHRVPCIVEHHLPTALLLLLERLLLPRLSVLQLLPRLRLLHLRLEYLQDLRQLLLQRGRVQ